MNPMSSAAGKLITGLAAAFAVAGSTTAASEARAAEILQTAQMTAERLTSCPATADDLVGDATLRILQKHPEAFEETKGWHGYVRQSIRNAFRDELRRRGWTQNVTDLECGGGLADWLEGGMAPFEQDDVAGALVIEEFRSILAPAEREVLDGLLLGHRERQLAEELGRTRHDIRASLRRLRHAAEPAQGAED